MDAGQVDTLGTVRRRQGGGQKQHGRGGEDGARECGVGVVGWRRSRDARGWRKHSAG